MAKSTRWPRLALAGLLFAGAAWASPWDIDMIDAYFFKAYEWEMKPQPKGAVAREALSAPRPFGAGHYQNSPIAQITRSDAASMDAMVNPYASEPNHVSDGARLYRQNCAACHGLEGKGGGPVVKNDPANGINRYLIPAPLLAGKGGVNSLRSDGYLYATIRNGGAGSGGATSDKSAIEAAIGAGMPAYGALLTDAERWAIVAYLRTLPESQYTPPAPAEPATTGNPG